ncbi:hypothetical protein [Planctomicrobium sp. SH664]|uniref:hypothetical protein n=1 Tax=Planctomicrobium sp. SH664 TaxID=3448125 RepID=UPI003F5B62CC
MPLDTFYVIQLPGEPTSSNSSVPLSLIWETPATTPRRDSSTPARSKTTGVTVDIKDQQPSPTWRLRLYVDGANAALSHLLEQLQDCNAQLTERFVFESVDLLRTEQLLRGEEIVAMTTLLPTLPEPLHEPIAEFARSEGTLVGLSLISLSSQGER